jgi:hypothetical protein
MAGNNKKIANECIKEELFDVPQNSFIIWSKS